MSGRDRKNLHDKTGCLSALYTDQQTAGALGDLLVPGRARLPSAPAADVSRPALSEDELERVLRAFAETVGEDPDAVAEEFRKKTPLARSLAAVFSIMVPPRPGRGARPKDTAHSYYHLVRQLKQSGLNKPAILAAIPANLSARKDGYKTKPESVWKAWERIDSQQRRRHQELIDRWFQALDGN